VTSGPRWGTLRFGSGKEERLKRDWLPGLFGSVGSAGILRWEPSALPRTPLPQDDMGMVERVR
jgi:hypothetical protein